MRIACSYSLLEQLQYIRKSDWHPCLCLQYFPKDQPRLRAERGEVVLETPVRSVDRDRAVHFQHSQLYFNRGYTNSINLGAVVGFLW